LDLALHTRLLSLVRDLVGDEAALVDGVHDVSDGGLGAALAEMAVQSGVGFRVVGIPDHVALFGEGPSRVVVSVPAAATAELRARTENAGVGVVALGRAGGDRIVVDGLVDVSLADAVRAWQRALPEALGVEPARTAGINPRRETMG
jgi:phosphoribosylformylglycinamidine synthase